MKIKEEKKVLKNGKICILRSLVPEDAGELLKMMEITFEETDYMSRYPEEKLADEDYEAVFLKNTLEDDREFMICAVADGRIVGNLGVSRILHRIKYRHRAEFGISVLSAYWGMGIGRLLMEEGIKYAREARFEQLELEVVTENKKALALYQKMGFEIYGERPNSFKYKDNTYGGMYLMLKDLEKVDKSV